MSTGPRQTIPALTGLRGIAALWVAAYHYEKTDIGHVPSGPIGHGYLAVDIFFVLSGFVMGLSYRDLFEGGLSAAHYGKFMLRRIARVYPLYLAMTLAIGAGMRFGIGDPRLFALPRSDIAANFALVQGWGFGPSLDGPAWSVSAELLAYLLFPLLLTGALFSRRVVSAGLAFACFGLMLWLEATPLGINPWRIGPMDIFDTHDGLDLLRCLGEFTLGLLALRIARHPLAMALADSSVLTLMVLAALGVTISVANWDYLVVVLAPLLVLGLTGRNLFARALGARLPVFLGEISYAVYLVHDQLLRLHRIGHARLDGRIGAGPAGIASELAFFAAAILSGYAAYRFIEKPARETLRRAEGFLFGRRRGMVRRIVGGMRQSIKPAA